MGGPDSAPGVCSIHWPHEVQPLLVQGACKIGMLLVQVCYNKPTFNFKTIGKHFQPCLNCRNKSRIEADEDEVSESGQSSSKSETEVWVKPGLLAVFLYNFVVFYRVSDRLYYLLSCVVLIQEHHHKSAHEIHDEHKHRFVHSHKGELAGSFVSLK